MDIAPVEKSVTNRTAFGDISFILSTNLGISRFGLTGVPAPSKVYPATRNALWINTTVSDSNTANCASRDTVKTTKARCWERENGPCGEDYGSPIRGRSAAFG